MAASRLSLFLLLALGIAWPLVAQGPGVIPVTSTSTLDGRPLTLPRDLSAPATVFILGFGQHSEAATTAWEHPVRTQLAHPGSLGFYDAAMLADVPGFVRPMVLRLVRHKVPDVLKPNFLTLDHDEAAWKRIAGYTPDAPEAAYVLLLDRSGHVVWSTHQPFSPAAFATLRAHAESLAGHTL